ncbi:MAG: pirin family protein [Bacteroidetes bacterium]|nr:pirin family protein [Bacteroidota bacterium]
MATPDNRSNPGDAAAPGALEALILPRTSEIAAGFTVRRALPSSRRRMVGPFIFLDQMGPEVLQPGRAMDVAPHPHIGLATVTYLFEGEALHRDSLGTRQHIRAGDVNWMTAGRGIAHSERTPNELRGTGSRIFGIQSWVALPMRNEEDAPSFAHHEAKELPTIEGEGKHVRLIAGSLFGERSPVATHSDMFYADVRLDGGAQLPMPVEHEERAVYIVQGTLELDRDGGTFNEGGLLVLKPGEPVTLRAPVGSATQLLLLGGAAMDAPRHIWWNFVSSSRERIEQAKADWREGRFDPVPDETEFIPLPDDGPIIPRYP